ncbi:MULTISPECIES: DUF5065 family protein [Bacillus cereus group]|uniref:DUF5065 family protein n=1 Tax=Bacillus cereus group TaxID=86661 RepID=UPI0008CD1048|nr:MULTISPECIES: DUF5065 family protein [Bacillus cereus group]MCU4807727.1 DUF5065 family protein [Bacillus cereus]MCU4819518.1 DUF5065 family protein [Bacillus cereus]MCU5120700.1 DUF5065 family protein [Bacillus cereus]MCU5143754.1 DUF5065 family protein [Bacillus cereus]MCU5634575.1 DUF5065 family protein [Bacillus cereus]
MKLGKLALAGALALGGLAGFASLDAKPAAAAEKVQAASTTWSDPTSLFDLAQFAWDFPHYLADDVQSSYKTGGFFQVKMGWYNGVDGNPMKIYRVMDNNSLVRYKTMYPFPAHNGTINEAVWYADITSAYEPGNYIAVVNIDGNFYQSKIFTINK